MERNIGVTICFAVLFIAVVHCEETACEKQSSSSANGDPPLVGAFVPKCEADGSFKKEQCHDSTGHCWCVDTDTGVEINDTRTGPTADNSNCEKLCLHQTSRLNANPAPGAFSPQCKDDGSYKDEQCHASSGHCWCVNPHTGVEIPNTRTTATEDNTKCGKVDGTTCQKHLAAENKKGPMPGQFIPTCEEDGSYSKEQCHGSTGHCWCVNTENGKEIDGSRTGPTVTNTNCETLGDSASSSVKMVMNTWLVAGSLWALMRVTTF